MKNFLFVMLMLIRAYTGLAQLSQNGLLFDGVNDRVQVPNHPAYNVGTGDLTIEAWIRADSPSGANVWEYIVSEHISGSSTGFALALSYSGTPAFSINGSGYGPAGTFNMRDGLCHHLAVVRKDTLLFYYIDGVLLPGNATSTAAINTANPLCFGSYNTAVSPNPFKGLIKEVRLWNVARTNSQLLSGMSTVLASNATGLIGYWRMNATSGQTVTDFSLLANHGALGSTTAVETLDPAFSSGCPSCAQTIATITAGGPVAFCIGDSVLLSAGTGAGFTYQWHRNGVAISGAVAANYYAKLSGAYSVKLTNASACVSWSNAIDVTQKLDNTSGIICSGITVGSWACVNGGSLRTLSVGTGNGYVYQWKRNGANITGANADSYTTGVAGIYTCTVTAGSCSRTTASFELGPNPVTLITNGPTTSCSTPVYLMATRTYGSSSGVSYDWKSNGVSVGAPNYWTYTASQSGSYTCTVTDAICPGSFTSNAVGVTLGMLPSVYIAPSGVNQVISDCISSQVNLSAVDVNGNPYPIDPDITSFDWYKDGFPFTSFATQTTVSESGVYSLYISSTNCGIISSFQPKVVLMTNAQFPPAIQHGTLTNCTQVALYVNNIWLGYQWKLNGGVIAGATSANYNATQSGSYTCELFNACGSTTTSPVTVNITGGTPPVITAPGGTVICGTANKVLVAPTGTGYTYQWKLNGSNLPNGNLNAYYTNVPGAYTCFVTTSCGGVLSNAITLTAGPAIPAAPGTISGNNRPCPGTNSVSYSIQAVAGATTYTWTVPAGFTLVSGQGTTTIVVNVPVSFQSGAVTVKAGNTCGFSAVVSKSLTSKIPALPGTITGNTSGVCSSVHSYSINAVSQATGYTWTVPTGATIVSGQGTSVISVSFNSSFVGDSLYVQAYNNCGAGPSRSLYVKGRPAIPGAISGSLNVCAGQTGLVYSISPVIGAAAYTWTKPVGAVITNGQGTTQITMTMGPASGSLKVKASNACGASTNKTLALNVVCRENVALKAGEMVVAPNPFNSSFTVRLEGAATGTVKGVVYNSIGQISEQFQLINGTSLPIGERLPEGFYIVKVETEKGSFLSRIVKQ